MVAVPSSSPALTVITDAESVSPPLFSLPGGGIPDAAVSTLISQTLAWYLSSQPADHPLAWLLPFAQRLVRSYSESATLWRRVMMLAWAIEHLIDMLASSGHNSDEFVMVVQSLTDLHNAELAMSLNGGYDPMGERLDAAVASGWANVDLIPKDQEE